MLDISVVTAQQQHAWPIAERMRAIDRLEVKAASGSSPLTALTDGISRSTRSWTVMINDTPEAMMGVVDLGYTGIPWLLATDRLNSISKSLLMNSRKYVNYMLEVNNLLQNYVYAENIASIQWLKWLGFEVLPPEPYGIQREPFSLFRLRARYV